MRRRCVVKLYMASDASRQLMDNSCTQFKRPASAGQQQIARLGTPLPQTTARDV